MKNNFKNKNFIKNSKVLKILNIDPKSIKVIPKQELVYLNLRLNSKESPRVSIVG